MNREEEREVAILFNTYRHDENNGDGTEGENRVFTTNKKKDEVKR